MKMTHLIRTATEVVSCTFHVLPPFKISMGQLVIINDNRKIRYILNASTSQYLQMTW